MSCQSIKLEKQDTRNISGTYIWKYPDELATAIDEDNKIIIKKNNNKFEGLFYGTTDEFDRAREGYLPGYFVLNMEELRIDGDTVRFILQPKINDFFNEYIGIPVSSSQEAINKGLTHWSKLDNFTFITTKKYQGLLDSQTIYFEKDAYNGMFEKKFINVFFCNNTIA